MFSFLALLGDPEGDFFRAGRFLSILSNLLKESSPLISNIFKFFSFLVKFFTGNLIFIPFFLFFIILITLTVLYFKRRQKNIKKL